MTQAKHEELERYISFICDTIADDAIFSHDHSIIEQLKNYIGHDVGFRTLLAIAKHYKAAEDTHKNREMAQSFSKCIFYGIAAVDLLYLTKENSWSDFEVAIALVGYSISDSGCVTPQHFALLEHVVNLIAENSRAADAILPDVRMYGPYPIWAVEAVANRGYKMANLGLKEASKKPHNTMRLDGRSLKNYFENLEYFVYRSCPGGSTSNELRYNYVRNIKMLEGAEAARERDSLKEVESRFHIDWRERYPGISPERWDILFRSALVSLKIL